MMNREGDVEETEPAKATTVTENPAPQSQGKDSKRRFASDAVWLVFGQGATALAGIIGVRILTEVVPPEIYGSTSLIAGLLLLGRNLFCFPFYQAALRFFPELNREGEAWRLRRIVFGYISKSSAILVALTLLIGLPYCSYHKMPLILMPIIIGMLLVDISRTMETDMLNAARRQRSFSILRAADAWSRPIAAYLVVIWLGPNTVSVMGGYLLGCSLVLASIFVFKVQRVGVEKPPESEPNESKNIELRERLWRFSMPLVPLAILEWTTSLSPRYVIGGLIGLDSAGIYIAAYGLVSQPFLISSAVLEMLARPVYFEALASGNHALARKVFRKWLLACSAVCVLGVVAITILRVPVINLLLAKEYRSATSLLPWIAAGNAMFAVAMVYEKVFHAVHRTELVLVSRTIGAVLSLAVGIPMILAFGLIGAASSVPICFGVQLIVAMWLANRVAPRESDDSSA